MLRTMFVVALLTSSALAQNPKLYFDNHLDWAMGGDEAILNVIAINSDLSAVTIPVKWSLIEGTYNNVDWDTIDGTNGDMTLWDAAGFAGQYILRPAPFGGAGGSSADYSPSWIYSDGTYPVTKHYKKIGDSGAAENIPSVWTDNYMI